MTFEPKTIAEQIECLARLTGAPQSFVCQVKDLFYKKGIALTSDAAPYLTALEEAFKREEAIRTNAQRARQNIHRLATNFNKIGRSYVRQLEQLKKIQSDLHEQGKRLRRHARRAPRTRARIEAAPEIPSKFMTPPVNDQIPMVPGPEEEQ
jgi:hypothetical protein